MKRRVLLVEDEDLIRLVGADALEEAGYEVIDAANAEAALEILNSASEFNVLFTDIKMPGSMDGIALARLVHERWPDIKILITSGDTWPPKDLIPEDGRFLPKPYRIERLQGEVDDLLG
ncbi:MAG: response regulator [Novosphingobium lindaniclasticum]|jgi:CheY-like chemotaxis protein|uniref:response regulator n=1 Tax=Novosphingobium lindaniclasticum TaxID=1329895 RepID=UPI0024098E5A|nr:response regulator [Novosphingobium lindaniclasticum]MDF2640541.1 response regulator [Novosphingobium lindaniclasticum]